MMIQVTYSTLNSEMMPLDTQIEFIYVNQVDNQRQGKTQIRLPFAFGYPSQFKQFKMPEYL